MFLPERPLGNERGAAMVTAMLVMALLTTLGISSTTTSNTEMQIAANDKVNKMAFYQAEAGVEYARIQVQNALAAGTLTLPTSTTTTTGTNNNQPVQLSYAPPNNKQFADYSFSTRVSFASDVFTITSDGTDANGSSTIVATFQRDAGDPSINMAISGNSSVDIKNSGQVYSYDSEETSSPTASDSTGEADIGSNGVVKIHTGTVIDGDVALGDDGAGNEAVLNASGTPIVSGTMGVDIDRVDPDPLGAIGGDLASDFTQVISSNSNAAAGIGGTTLNLRGTLTLPPGDYFFTSIVLRKGAVLNVQPGVDIYLSGPLDAKNGSTINIFGQPTDFNLYSNSTANIHFKHGSTFKGLIYAPYADVQMHNSADIYGAIVADSALLNNTGRVFFDTAIRDNSLSTPSNALTMLSWREVRN